MELIGIEQLEFAYAGGEFVLRVPKLSIMRGEKVAFIGPSGSGKTTLISLIAGILTARCGAIRVAGVDLAQESDAARRDLRISRIGFVFQEFALLDYLNVRENILLPYYLNGTLNLDAAARARADALATSLGIGNKLRRRPNTLSQGERQRVAICRALVAQPDLLIADEPTGNLDPQAAARILDALQEQVAVHEATLLVVTHNHALLDRFDRVVDLSQLVAGDAA